MRKVRVVIKEWECKEVEYICEVDDADLENGLEWDAYGIGSLDGGDLGLDCEGFEATPIARKIIDNDADSKWEVVKWDELEKEKSE
jgi:hypothetical protein